MSQPCMINRLFSESKVVTHTCYGQHFIIYVVIKEREVGMMTEEERANKIQDVLEKEKYRELLESFIATGLYF